VALIADVNPDHILKRVNLLTPRWEGLLAMFLFLSEEPEKDSGSLALLG